MAREGSRGRGWQGREVGGRGWQGREVGEEGGGGGGWGNFKGHSEIDYRLLGATTK